MTERIDERLEVMGVDTAGMTDEQKFTAATGLTRYTEYEANNAWYVPGGAANVPVATEEPVGPAGPTGTTSPTGQPKVETYTAAEAAAYNIAVTGTTKETGDELTTEEAAMYNAHLEGAISTEDYKVEPVEGVKYTQEDADTYNAELDGAVKEGDPKTSSAEIVTE